MDPTNAGELAITSYLDGDHGWLREICVRTAARGEDASGRHRRPELIPLVYLDPYVVHEPQLVSVLRRVDLGTPVGYVVATADTAAFAAWAERDWWPALRDTYRSGARGLTSYDERLIAHFTSPPARDPAVLADYPAHLHIDLLVEARGQGWGRRLIDDLAGKLRERGIPGVHVEVGAQNTDARAFYAALGFAELDRAGDGITLGRRL